MELLIVGAGEMGRWFGATALAGVDGLDLAFADADPAVAEAAAGSVGGRAVGLDGDRRFDAVCFAVPMSATRSAIASGVDRATDAVVDVTGSMGPAVATMRTHASNRERLSVHPLFAADNAPGNVAVVHDRRGPTTDRLRAALTAAGNDVFETTPEAHDRAMETVQAKAHAAVLAFALAADPVPPEFATPVFEALSDVTGTVTGNDPAVYGEIQATFDGAGEVAAAAERVADADREGFEALYREAGIPIEGPGDGGPDGDRTDDEEEREPGADDENRRDRGPDGEDRRDPDADHEGREDGDRPDPNGNRDDGGQ